MTLTHVFDDGKLHFRPGLCHSDLRHRHVDLHVRCCDSSRHGYKGDVIIHLAELADPRPAGQHTLVNGDSFEV